MYGNNNGAKVFSIPVERIVSENIEVRANSLKEAVEFINKHSDEIPTSNDAAYIDGTWKISADEDNDLDTNKICERLACYGYNEREATEYDKVDSNIGGVA
ncbi:hypothetical protein [Butyrivibrio hungatei]|uniref:Uncharacterized protein n=1 Tax=Butyrivibrio hungatei TaxID=185008 RepID=A0A1D9P5T1_9FIRM|nr:hypothetical protein [Butyrivibrio hungatei]AOZ97927.1 hypothetical protein bhn_II128 [Butyrivibrio hungatei]